MAELEVDEGVPKAGGLAEAEDAAIGEVDCTVEEAVEEILAGTTSVLSNGRHVPSSGRSSENSVISNNGSSSLSKGVCASRIKSTP